MFNGSVTLKLTAMGLDSRLVLEACNAYRGSIEANSDKTKVVSETKLTGKLTEKKDGRRLTFNDRERYSSQTDKGDVSPPGLLLAFNDAIAKLIEVHDGTVVIDDFPPAIEQWLEWKRTVFAIKTATAGTVPAPAS